MAHPSFLSLKTITCLKTEDFTGSDELVGVLGNDRFSIGKFTAGTTRDVGIERIITPGVTELTIVEADALDPDDVLIAIDLTQDMDTDRVVGILNEGARYDVSFMVGSEPD
jgi:hypothetical protein